MCKITAFYEGGMKYSELKKMPLDEFFEIVDCANVIAKEREEKAKRGK